MFLYPIFNKLTENIALSKYPAIGTEEETKSIAFHTVMAINLEGLVMIVNHNADADSSLNRLNLNNTELSKDLQKISSGKRINSAVDGTSEYSIGEKMDVMIRALEQDSVNTKTGRNLLQVAEGGIQNVIDNIRSMREMALNSANDHNTDLDRATLQKDFEQRIKQIADIAATTNYNGRLLLNGDYAEDFYSGIGTGGCTTSPTFNPYVNEPLQFRPLVTYITNKPAQRMV